MCFAIIHLPEPQNTLPMFTYILQRNRRFFNSTGSHGTDLGVLQELRGLSPVRNPAGPAGPSRQLLQLLNPFPPSIVPQQPLLFAKTTPFKPRTTPF